MGTREVLAKEVGLKELYQIDNPYKTSLKTSFKAGMEQARVIIKEIKQGNVATRLVKIKKNGHISIDNLDIYGNIIRP